MDGSRTKGGKTARPVEALQSGKAGTAGLDVFAKETRPNDHTPLKFDQVVLTPRIGGLTQDAAEGMAISFAENILDFFGGKLDHTLYREQRRNRCRTPNPV